MTVTTKTVREIALENPAFPRVFEELGIDYCCGGRMPLDEACAKKNIEVGQVAALLEKAAQGPAPAAEDWTGKPLAGLAAHIVDTHHAYVKRELPRLHELAAKVVNRHGATHAELPVIQQKLEQLGEELTQHLAKEEMILFPYIAGMEKAHTTGCAKPNGCFGTVANPIAMMTQEHDDAGTLMAEMRQLSGDFTPPQGACPTFHAYYSGLDEFEKDLHQHIHLENNILFPRALELEQMSN